MSNFCEDTLKVRSSRGNWKLQIVWMSLHEKNIFKEKGTSNEIHYVGQMSVKIHDQMQEPKSSSQARTLSNIITIIIASRNCCMLASSSTLVGCQPSAAVTADGFSNTWGSGLASSKGCVTSTSTASGSLSATLSGSTIETAPNPANSLHILLSSPSHRVSKKTFLMTC